MDRGWAVLSLPFEWVAGPWRGEDDEEADNEFVPRLVEALVDAWSKLLARVFHPGGELLEL